MPLSKVRMRERKRLDRENVKPTSNLNGGTPVKPNVRPYSKDTQLSVPLSKAQVRKRVRFEQLKGRFDYRSKGE